MYLKCSNPPGLVFAFTGVVILFLTIVKINKHEVQSILKQREIRCASIEVLRCQFLKGVDIMAKVLLVDDEPGILFLTKRMLEGDGHEAILAKNSAECFEKLREIRPDLILLDIMMPGKDNGWTTCRKIKDDENTHDIPLAMFTVLSSDESQEKSYECGADAHINKPFYKDEFLKTVENLTKKSGP